MFLPALPNQRPKFGLPARQLPAMSPRPCAAAISFPLRRCRPWTVVYVMELNGRRVIFTGDIAFDDRRAGMPLGSNILHRCWADREKAATVIRVIEEKVLPLRPEFEFKGHASNRDPITSWRNILDASRKAMN